MKLYSQKDVDKKALKGARIAGDRLAILVAGLTAQGRAGPIEARVRVGGAVFPHERVHSSEDLLREANRVYRSLREPGVDKRVFDAP